MKRGLAVLLIVALVLGGALGFTRPVQASDWDKAGKALAILEGARVLTGGRVDPVGFLTGVHNGRQGGFFAREPRTYYAKSAPHCPEPVWVPEYTWKKKYISEHEEYSEKYGTVVVEGHYIRFRVEDGGHWD